MAFTVLVLVMGIFSQAMGLAGRMMNRSIDVSEDYHQLAGDYFLKKEGKLGSSETPVSLKFNRVTKDGKETGEVFTMKVIVQTYEKTGENRGTEISLYEVKRAVSEH